MIDCLFYFSAVLRIQFESERFSGEEDDTSILISFVMKGGIRNEMISVGITFSELNATSLIANHYIHVIIILIKGDDFNTTPLNVTFSANATNTTVRVAVTNDNIVEGNETFSMSLNVPSSLGPIIVAGSRTNATGIIIDTSSK